MTREQIEGFLEDLTAKAVADWWKAYMADSFAEIYLYYKASAGTQRGDMIAATEQPEGYDLAMPERLAGNLTRSQCARKVNDTLRTLPILPSE